MMECSAEWLKKAISNLGKVSELMTDLGWLHFLEIHLSYSSSHFVPLMTHQGIEYQVGLQSFVSPWHRDSIEADIERPHLGAPHMLGSAAAPSHQGKGRVEERICEAQGRRAWKTNSCWWQYHWHGLFSPVSWLQESEPPPNWVLEDCEGQVSEVGCMSVRTFWANRIRISNPSQK